MDLISISISISIVPFIAILLFILAVAYRKCEVGAVAWLFFAVYCIHKIASYIADGEYFESSVAIVFLAFTLLLVAFMLKPKPKAKADALMGGSVEKGDENLFYTINRFALITAAFYFPFAEIHALETLLIYITTISTVAVLNLFNVSVYMVYPALIYSTDCSFHEIYRAVRIILDCTGLSSMALFMGLIFGVNGLGIRKLKAFIVSVPAIYVLNIARNVFIIAAYFEHWFGCSPLDSFFIAHDVIGRIFAMIALIAIAYAVFVILPETLDLIEDFFSLILRIRLYL